MDDKQKRALGILSLLDKEYVTPKDLSELFGAFVSTIKDLKDNLALSIEQGDSSLEDKLATSKNNLSEVISTTETKLSELIAKHTKNHSDKISSLASELYKKIEEVKQEALNSNNSSDLYGKLTAFGEKLASLPNQEYIQKEIAAIREEIIQWMNKTDDKVRGVSKMNPPNGPMLHPTSLGNLPDVSVVGVTNGQTIVWNGTAWVPGTGGSGGLVGSQEKSTTIPNGILTTFTFTHIPLVIHWNGAFQTLTDDYTVSGNTITFTASAGIPQTNDKIVNIYA